MNMNALTLYKRAKYIRTSSPGSAARLAAYRLAGSMARPAAKWAGRKINRAAKKYLAGRKRKAAVFSKNHIGERIGTTNSKTAAVSYLEPTLSTRTLDIQELYLIPRGTDINARERDHMTLTGIRSCIHLRNSLEQPQWVHVAIVGVKQTTGNVPNTTKFFRANGTNRVTDFDNSLTGLEFMCLPINTDDYTILKHKRFNLPGTASSTPGEANFNNRPNYRMLKMWTKVKRQIRYEDNNNTSNTDGRLWMLVWCDYVETPGGSVPTANALAFTSRHVTYFSDPKV